MEHTSLPVYLEIAVAAATAAGRHALKHYGRRRDVVRRSAHDVKLQLDLECQARAEEVIRRHFSEHRVLGEEGGAFRSGPEPLWIIDPIDGTVNFTHGLPFWCCSVALQLDGRMVAGAVVLPMLNECYRASRETPAFCNDEPLRVSAVSRRGEALVLTGLHKDPAEAGRALEFLSRLSAATEKTRMLGAAAADLCQVARGRAEGFFESRIYLWDVAAAGLILERAGGRVEVLERYDDVSLRILGTNGLLHDELKALVT
ncbi:MAG: inositol monophosphatase family protein [Kiritimatiellaeota bacterium]|nr:inositol monophosphatase family protein [Kiritimatiellota bacterium]